MRQAFVISQQSVPFYGAHLRKQGSSVALSSVFDAPILVKISTTHPREYVMFPSYFILFPHMVQEVCISLTLTKPLENPGEHRYCVEAFAVSQKDAELISNDTSPSLQLAKEFWRRHVEDVRIGGKLFTQKNSVQFLDGAPSEDVQRLAVDVPTVLLDSHEIDNALGTIQQRKARYMNERAALLQEIDKQQARIDLLKQTLSRDETEIARLTREIGELEKRIRALLGREYLTQKVLGIRLQMKAINYLFALMAGLLLGRLLHKL
ncbi:hypothetical protein GMRT_10767 [Giardia muris]|uniref:MSP domain-containing protein n=1 Tax=Giardia muris TaxID=5742 RepID=A0A4Z1T0Z3_GIAMU|nr:hypothetical protein GMRT_10767 [Giardia muris]|eukprot:TNJ30645.1 hypothetical protein GMRT_10767 [Giardia muris]